MITIIASTDINTLSYTHTVASGADAQYKIRAKSTDRGEGANSTRATFIIASIPTISAAPTIDSKTASSITVSWTLSDNGGTSILGYRLYRYNKATGAEVLAYDGSLNSVITSYSDTGLSPGITYGYRVLAINRVGISALSPEVTEVPSEKPGKPPAPTYISSDSDSISLQLYPTTETNGLTITRYHLYRDQGSLTSNFSEITSYLGTDMTFDVTVGNETNMTVGTEYRFYFTARNSLGEGPESDISTFGLGSLPTAPSTPSILTEYSTRTSLFIEWSELTGQDLPVEGYRLYGEDLIYDGFNQPSTFAYNVTNLTTGESYSFYIIAKNVNGESEPSGVVSGYACLPPSGLDPPVFVEASTDYITVSWAAPESDGG